MQGIVAIGRAKAIVLPVNGIDPGFQKAACFPYHTPTSLQLDVQSGKANTERELCVGAVLAYGEGLGIAVAETSRLCQEIKERLGQSA